MALHKLLFGDKSLAAKWVGFAVHKLGLLHGRHNSAVYKPDRNTTISVRRVASQEYVTISVRGAFGYEFVAADYSRVDTGDDHDEIGTYYKVSSTGVDSANAVESLALLSNEGNTEFLSRPAAIGNRNMWEQGDTVVLSGLGQKYISNVDILYSAMELPLLNNRLSAFQYTTPINQPIEITKPSKGERVLMSGVDGCAAAVLNGVLISIGNGGDVKATLVSDSAGANVKTYSAASIVIPRYTGHTTTYWTFNKTGDAAVAVVHYVNQTQDNDPPELDRFYIGYALVKMSFAVAVTEDGTDFELAIVAEEVLQKANPDLLDFEPDSIFNDIAAELPMVAADFHYTPTTDTTPEIERIVTLIARRAGAGDGTGNLEAVVVNAEDITDTLLRIPLSTTSSFSVQPIVSIAQADLRTLSFVCLEQNFGFNTYTLGAYVLVNGVEVYRVGEDHGIPAPTGVDTTDYVYDPSESAVAALAANPFGFLTVRGDNWAAYAQAPDEATFLYPGPNVGYVLDKIVVEGDETSHQKLYDAAFAAYTPPDPDPTPLIAQAPADFNVWDDRFLYAENGAFYTRN